MVRLLLKKSKTDYGFLFLIIKKDLGEIKVLKAIEKVSSR